MAGTFWYGIYTGHAQTQLPAKNCVHHRGCSSNPLTNVRRNCNLISSLPWADRFFGGQAYCLASVLRI
jgi:hypothetical protein